MTEKQVGFLCKAASTLPLTESNSTLKLLRSYYLMRCKEVTKGYGLPVKHFSSKTRCSQCCLEWNQQTDVKIKSSQLSKRQRKRIKSLKTTNKNKEYIDGKKELLKNNQLVHKCTFCEHSTTNILEKLKTKRNPDIQQVLKQKSSNSSVAVKTEVKNEKDKSKIGTTTGADIFTNIYSSAKDVFSLQNKSNTLKSSLKEPAKIIKNNKGKKDKFAGLCQQAVLSSLKVKQEKDKQNKLNMFLKPSS